MMSRRLLETPDSPSEEHLPGLRSKVWAIFRSNLSLAFHPEGRNHCGKLIIVCFFSPKRARKIATKRGGDTN